MIVRLSTCQLPVTPSSLVLCALWLHSVCSLENESLARSLVLCLTAREKGEREFQEEDVRCCSGVGIVSIVSVLRKVAAS